MVKFDFINSSSRKSWLKQKDYSQTFILGAIVSAGFLVIAFLLLFQSSGVLAGLGQIILGLVLLLLSSIISARYASPKIDPNNLVDHFSNNLIELCDKIYEEAKNEGIAEITSVYFFQKASLTTSGTIIFVRLGIPLAKTNVSRQKAAHPVFSADFVEMAQALLSKALKIELEDMLKSIVSGSSVIQKYLGDFKITVDDFKIVATWMRDLNKTLVEPKFWQKSFVVEGIGEEWSFGYTPILSQYSRDLSVYFQDPNLTVNTYSHASKLNDIQAVLSKPQKNNCLLVGQPGVGKKSIVNGLAAKIAHGDCLESLKYKRIRQMDVARLISGGTKSELVERINNAFAEAINAGNIILYIDNFESLLGSSASGIDEVGGIDASQVMLPFFQNSGLRIIASISPENYFNRVRNNPGITTAFEKIDVEPATIADTIAMMLENVGSVEHRNNVFITYQAMKSVVELSDRYIHDIPFPEKALNLMEEAAVTLGGKGQLHVIDSTDIEDFISKKVKVPIGTAKEGEKQKLLNLENLLHARVVGQNEAINAVSDALRRVRSGLTSGKRPVGVFLFLGPTGVGKTETAKALAESYFGSEKNMIRLDMSEYQEPSSIDRLIGSTTNPSGILTDQILANPFSLILLDEIEKADKNVLNVFLQVFEDGRLTDVRGRVSDFTNAIIIATSNAGSEFIRENMTTMRVDQLKENLVNKLQQDGIFTPEFLNRFDATIVYKPLTLPELQKVASLMLAEVNKLLIEKKITVTVEPDALTKLVELGNDPQFGARPMRRVIQEKVENLLAKKMLEGTVAEGGTLNVILADII